MGAEEHNNISLFVCQHHKHPYKQPTTLTNEPHDQKADSRRPGDLHELLPVRLGAFLHEVDGVLRELLEGLDEHLVESLRALATKPKIRTQHRKKRKATADADAVTASTKSPEKKKKSKKKDKKK